MAHTPYSELEEKIKLGKEKVVVGGKYHHWKDSETHYTILHVGLAEWSEEIVVIYQHEPAGVVWVRRLEGEDGWLTPVERDGDDKRRFVPVS